MSRADSGPRPPLRSTFRALKNPNYRLFWFGQLGSVTGTWMQRVAQAWLVLRISDSPLALGTLSTVQFTPILVFSLFGGVLADRLPKRRVLLMTQSVMLAQALAIAVLTSLDLIALPLLYVLAGVLGVASAVDQPTRQAFIGELVGLDDLANAVALNSTQFNAARIVGPALGGIAIAAVGVAGCFYLNAASFLAVLGSLVLMRPDRFFHFPKSTRGNVFKQLGEGVRYAVSTPDILLVIILLAVIGTFGYNFTVVLPLIAKYVLNANPEQFGILFTAMGAGSLLAALSIAYSGRATRTGLLMGASGFSVLLFALGASRWWAMTIPVIVALGFASIIFTATANTRLQRVTPPHLRGRVMSIYALLFAGTTPIGSFVFGWLAEHGGVGRATQIVAAVCGFGVLLGLVYVRSRGSKLLPEPHRSREPALTGGD